jgi:hypothetical protein
VQILKQLSSNLYKVLKKRLKEIPEPKNSNDFSINEIILEVKPTTIKRKNWKQQISKINCKIIINQYLFI